MCIGLTTNEFMEVWDIKVLWNLGKHSSENLSGKVLPNHVQKGSNMTIEFIRFRKQFIMVYTPISGATEILKRIKSDDGYNIKNIFWVTTSMLREMEDYDEDSICISLGKEKDGYVEIDQNVINTKHKFFF